MARKVRNKNRVDLNASDIIVADAGSLITAEDLENILQEVVGNINTNASDIGTAETDIDNAETELDFFKDMVMGDMAIVVAPTTLGSSAAAINAGIGGDGFTRDVTIALQNTAGNPIEVFNGSLPVAVSVSSNGTEAANIDGATTITFVEGEASVTINYTGAWAEGDTCTLTVGDTSSILGYSVSNATSVDTVIA